jgi:hypothetical protein
MSISPRLMGTPFTSTNMLSVSGFQLSIWYNENSIVTFSALVGSGPELIGIWILLDICGVSFPNKPRNSVNPGSLIVLPGDHVSPTVGPAPSKLSSSTTTSG